MTREDIKQTLFDNADLKYRDFSMRLNPGVTDMIGVRMPILRKLARSIAKSDPWGYCEHADEYFEERMLCALIFDYTKDDDGAAFAARAFIPAIADWNICDTFCTAFRFADRRPDETLVLLEDACAPDTEFGQRVKLVMLLKHFLKDDYIDMVFEEIGSIRCAGYYSKMAKAWLVAEAAISYGERARAYIEAGCGGDREVLRMTVRKLCESYRIPDGFKLWAKQQTQKDAL